MTYPNHLAKLDESTSLQKTNMTKWKIPIKNNRNLHLHQLHSWWIFQTVMLVLEGDLDDPAKL